MCQSDGNDAVGVNRCPIAVGTKLLESPDVPQPSASFPGSDAAWERGYTALDL